MSRDNHLFKNFYPSLSLELGFLFPSSSTDHPSFRKSSISSLWQKSTAGSGCQGSPENNIAKFISFLFTERFKPEIFVLIVISVSNCNYHQHFWRDLTCQAWRYINELFEPEKDKETSENTQSPIRLSCWEYSIQKQSEFPSCTLKIYSAFSFEQKFITKANSFAISKSFSKQKKKTL